MVPTGAFRSGTVGAALVASANVATSSRTPRGLTGCRAEPDHGTGPVGRAKFVHGPCRLGRRAAVRAQPPQARPSRAREEAKGGELPDPWSHPHRPRPVA